MKNFAKSFRSITIPISHSYEVPKDLVLVSDNRCYRQNHHYHHFNHIISSVLTALSPSTDNYIFDKNARFSLLSSPLLLVSSSLESDIFNALVDCGGILGFQVQSVSCRLFMNYNSDREIPYESSLCNYYYDLTGIASIVSSLSSITESAPTIMYIEGLDRFIESITKNDNDLLDKFVSNLSIFFTDLYNGIREKVFSNNDMSIFDRTTILIVSSTGNANIMSTTLRMLFTSEINLDKVDRDTRSEPFTSNSTSISVKKSSNLKLWKEAEQRGGLAIYTYKRLLMESKLSCLKRHRGKDWLYNCGLIKQKPTSNDGGVSIMLTELDINHSLKNLELGMKQQLSSNGKIAPVYWEDIGGLDNVRKEIMDSLLPNSNFDSSRKKRGILLFGPPGTGKTLVAKAVATECGIAFISVKGPELLDVYVGESEKNVRDLFANARDLAPCVMFFDELDSLAPARGRGNDAGGVMDRVVAQLLTEIDTLSSSNIDQVFIIGATNRPDLLDKALLRPSRFDTKIFLNVCNDISSRVAIMKAQMRKFSVDNNVNLDHIATLLPPSVTGADIGALTSSAYFKALNRKLEEIKSRAVSLGIIDDIDNNDKNSEYSINQYLDSLDESEILITINSDDYIQQL